MVLFFYFNWSISLGIRTLLLQFALLVYLFFSNPISSFLEHLQRFRVIFTLGPI